MSTHKEKDKLIKDLKSEIRELRAELEGSKKSELNLDELPSKAYGVILTKPEEAKRKHFTLVELAYNQETHQASVIKFTDLGYNLPIVLKKAKEPYIDIIANLRKEL